METSSNPLGSSLSLEEAPAATERARLSWYIGLLVGPTTLWMVLLFLVPVLFLLGLTFGLTEPRLGLQGLTLQHYRDFLSNTAFHALLGKSLWIAFGVALLSMFLAYPLAHFLVFRAGDLQVPLLTVLIIPAWTSFLLRVLAWRVILGSNGLLNSLLVSLGLPAGEVPILLYSPTAVIVTLVYVWVPFAAIPIVASLQRVDRSLLESASDLGARPWRAFLSITLPLAAPGLIAAFLFVFIPTVGEYVTPSLVGGTQGVMYGNIIWDQFSRALNWPQGALMSLVLLLVVLIPLLLLVRLARVFDLTGVTNA
jgi:spermidine/putrescine transport system permease protein